MPTLSLAVAVSISGTALRQQITAKANPLYIQAYREHPELHEQSVGEWSGKSKTKIPPELLARYRSGAFRPPGGESDKAFKMRVMSFWCDFALRRLCDDGDNLLIATSGNPIRVILGSIWKTSWRNLLPSLVLDNADITTIAVDKEGKCFVGPVNDISHLRNVGVTPIPGT